jgi:hypothetical protein
MTCLEAHRLLQSKTFFTTATAAERMAYRSHIKACKPCNDELRKEVIEELKNATPEEIAAANAEAIEVRKRDLRDPEGY